MDGNAGRNKTVGLLILGVLGVLYYLYSSDRSSPRSTAKKVEPPAPSAKNPIVTLNEKALDVSPAEADKALLLTRRKAAEDEAVHLKSLPLKTEKGQEIIPFQFEPRKIWCQAGDLDTMAMAAGASNAIILISIETLSGEVKDSLLTSVNQLKLGMNHVFRIQTKPGEKAYALNICSDIQKAGRCFGKNLQSHRAISDAAAQKKTAKSDFLYFFQPLVISEQTLYTYNSSDVSAPHQAQVGKVLGKRFQWTSKDLATTAKLSEVTGSIPGEVQGNKVVVRLPYNDPQCTGKPSGT